MQKDYTIIDNAVPNMLFTRLKDVFFNQPMGWFWLDSSAYENKVSTYHYSFVNYPLTPSGDTWEPAYSLCCSALYAALGDHYQDINITRIRAGMHTAHSENIINEPHVDQDDPHMVALLYLNDSDGPTYLHNNRYKKSYKEEQAKIYLKDIDLNQSIKVESKENRLVLFKGDIYHSSTKQTWPSKRVALNYNFLPKSP